MPPRLLRSGRATRALSALALTLAAALAFTRAAAEPVQPVAPAGGTISVDVDKAYTLKLMQAAKTVFVANPAIADVQAEDPSRVVVFGRKAGATSVYVTTSDGHLSAYTVEVRRPSDQLLAALKAQAPGSTLQVDAGPRGVTITGEASDPREAAALKATAQTYLADNEPLNLDVKVRGETQVNLQVRIVEVSRSVTHSLGFSWDAVSNNGSTILGLATGRQILSATGQFMRDSGLNASDSVAFGYRSPGGSVNINGVLDALQTEGLISVLAEPNLTASSGETASFLAGGEFPIPVAQQNQSITVEWKRFGVSLQFTPTVLDPGRLSIKVAPEVSELTDQGAVTVNSIKIPGLVVRRAATTIELASGQSFAIAGLFQNNVTNSIQKFPGLGDVPVLGQLFRSQSFIRNESELVIIVTPYIVRPTTRLADLKTPADGLLFANELEQALYGRLTPSASAGPPHPHLSGPAGFLLEDKP